MKFHRLTLVFVMALAGCGITGKPVPQDHFYRLPQANFEVLSSPTLDSLQLVSVSADGLYNERNLLYVDASRPLEIGRYHYHYWVESPLSLIGKYMAEAIKVSQVSAQFTGPGEKATASGRLSIQIVRFERVIDESGVSVQVALQVTMNYTTNAERWQKLYQIDQPVESSDMQDTARAFGEALNSISRMLIKDLSNS